MFSSVAGTRRAFKKAVSLGAALLPFNTACDITSTTENANPSVRIEEIVVDGYDPATANVFIHATDPDSKQNRQLSHGDYFLNGTKEGTVPLTGSDERTSFRLPRLSPTEYSLEIIVYDRAGASGTTFEHFTVSSEPRRVTAEVYVNRTHGIERVTEGELCLSDDCAPINSEGIARFDSLSSGGNVVVRIPEHYHQMFMVSLGERRLDKNIINYTNSDYLNGRIPTDTLITKGDNHRIIVFFENSKRWQDPLDDYGAISLQYINHIFQFMHAGDTLNLYVTTASGTVPDSLATKIWNRTKEAVDQANKTYESIPWRDPQTYILQPGMTSIPAHLVEFGEIVIDPNARFITANARLLDEKNPSELGAMWSMLNINHSFGERGVEHYSKHYLLKFLSGIKYFAPAGSNRFTQNPVSKEALLHEVVEEDLIAMRLYSIYSPGTRYLTTAEIEAGLLNNPGGVAFAPSFEQRF